jgi:hypothetical protein
MIQQVHLNSNIMKNSTILTRISILGMLITSFFIYYDQPTFGQYTFYLELDIWKNWNHNNADSNSYKYLLYAIFFILCRIYNIFLVFTSYLNERKILIYMLMFTIISIYGFGMSPFIFFSYLSFLPHLFFIIVSYLLVRLK